MSGAGDIIAEPSFRCFRSRCFGSERLTPPGLRRLIGSFAIAAVIFNPAVAHSAVRVARPTANETNVSHPHVYLMRGLLNIFSLGMDQLAAQIQSRGIDANVYNHTLADGIDNQIVQKYRAGDHGPYILIGHSLGADAVMTMAQALNANGVPVALVVPFDGTGSYAASRNVACVLNLTQRAYAYMRAGAGFHGKLQNVDVSSDTSIDHFTIDKSPRLQAMALSSVVAAAHSESCRPSETSPVVARPKGLPTPPSELPASKEVTAPKELTAPKETPDQSVSPGLRSGYEG
jgi:hypothetical protein